MKYLILFFILISLNLSAQDFFQRTYGGPGSEFGRGVVQTSDGGYACVGATNSYEDGSSNVYLIKVDELGNYMWGRNIGDMSTIEWGMDIVEDSEGNLIIAGYTNNTDGFHYQGLLIKVSDSGEILWQNTYGEADWDFFESLDIDEENSIYAVGNTFRENSQQGWILKVDENGNEIWDEIISDSDNIYLTGVSYCENEIIGFVGYEESVINESNAFISGAIDVNGNIEWRRTEAGWGNIKANDCKCYNDFIYSIGTIFSSEGSSFYLARQELELGNAILNTEYESSLNLIGESVGVTNSGNFILAGAGEFIFFEGLDAFIVQTDLNGIYISNDFNDTFGQPGDESFMDIFVTSDGGYVAIGSTNSFDNGDQVYLVKISSEGETDPTNEDFLDLPTSTEEGISQNSSIYPNPTQRFINIEATLPVSSVTLNDLNGKEILEYSQDYPLKNPEKLDLSGVKSGVYLLVIEYSNKTVSYHKIIKN